MAALTKQQVKDIIAKAPPGTSPAGIVAALRAEGHTLEGYPSDTTAAAPAPQVSQNPNRSPLADMPLAPGVLPNEITPATVVPQLGSIAGLAGNMAGGTPGATIGGLLGGGAQQGLSAAYGLPGAPANFAQGRQAAEKEAVLQGATAGLGGLATKGAGFLGNRMIATALKTDPEAAQTMIDEGIKATKGGLQKVMTRLGQGGEAVRELARRATAKLGAPFQSQSIAGNALRAITAEPESQALGTSEQQALHNLYGKFVDDYPDRLTPTRLHQIIRKYDGVADAVYKAENSPIPQFIPPAQKLEAQFSKALADEARSQLGTLPPDKVGVRLPNGQRVNTIQDANQYLSKLIRVKNAFPAAAGKGIPLGGNLMSRMAMAGGAGVAGAALPGTPVQRVEHGAEFGLGMAAFDPQVRALVGLALANPQMGQVLRYLPQFVGGGLQGTQ